MMIVLGSSSPRRKELLSHLVSSFEIKTADIDESVIPGESPLDHCRRLAEEKGAAVINQLGDVKEECLSITSDTIVTAQEKILGKPKDRDDAFRIINFLSGKSHQVITAVTLSLQKNGKQWTSTTGHETTQVIFKELSGADINRYLDLIHFSDKAGAYAIQEHGELIIESIDGSRSNVIGFPEKLFTDMLKDMKLEEILTHN